MSDPRCAYIAGVASSSFATPQLADQIANSKEVQQFVNELTCKVLQVLSDGKQVQCLAGSLTNPKPEMLEIHFVKLAEGSEELTPQRIQH
jgi:hypothetical protein